MNHRDLILAADRKCKSAFLALPAELQDEVIDGLDAGELTLQAAAEVIRKAGHKLSFQAIAEYYRLVRRERRTVQVRDALTRLVAQFGGEDPADNQRVLLNLALASAIQGLADGDLKIKDLDLARLAALSSARDRAPGGVAGAGELETNDGARSSGGAAGLSEAAAETIRQKILTGK